jgi:hypothetical protein
MVLKGGAAAVRELVSLTSEVMEPVHCRTVNSVANRSPRPEHGRTATFFWSTASTLA